jgi:hypothetical protein
MSGPPMRDRSENSHPPSDPHPVVSRSSALAFAAEERPVRVPLIAALLLGLVLVASGLYLWRRPHTPADPSAGDDPAGSAAALASGAAPAAVPPGPVDASPPSPVALSDARVLGCHDRGPKVTPADQCDHVATVEKALSAAVEQAATCVPADASGATIEYVADVSFLRRKVMVTLPRSGRSVHDRKVLHACAVAVRSAMQGVALDGVDHQHARYKIAVTATYRGGSTAAGATGATGPAGSSKGG